MNRVAWGIWCTKLVGVVLAMLCSIRADATTLAAPEPIAVLFQAGTDRPTPDGLLALDRLAVRAAQCPAKDLAVHLQAAGAADMVLAQRRLAAVQQHMRRLGLGLLVEMQPLRQDREEEGRTARREELLADVGADDDVWCVAREGSLLYAWVQELARYVDGGSPVAPAFWRLLATPVKLHELVQPLATAAYCRDPSGCRKHPALYRWLAEQALGSASVETRRDWLLQLWTLADDAEVERFRARWALAPLTVEERAGRAAQMVWADLPWALIERRLLAPEVMRRFGDRTMIGGSGPDELLWVASHRNELDSFDRLIDAAGPAKACFVQGAFRAAVLGDEFDRLKSHFASWARGLSVPYQPRGAYEACNPAAVVLVGAYCGPQYTDAAEAARYEAIWASLQQAGLSMDSPAIRPLMSPGAAIEPWQCRLEPVPGSATRLRPTAKP